MRRPGRRTSTPFNPFPNFQAIKMDVKSIMLLTMRMGWRAISFGAPPPAILDPVRAAIEKAAAKRAAAERAAAERAAAEQAAAEKAAADRAAARRAAAKKAAKDRRIALEEKLKYYTGLGPDQALFKAIQHRASTRLIQTLIAKVRAIDPQFINSSSKQGYTPLHMAARLDDDESVDMLLQNGADLFAKNDLGQTPREVARIKRHSKLWEYLVVEEWKVTLSPVHALSDKTLTQTPPRISTEELKLVRKIGKGGYGTVYKSHYRSLTTAAKAFNHSSLSQILKEATLLASLSSEYITQFIALIYSDNGVFLVTEYAAGGDLLDYLMNPEENIPRPLRMQIIRDVAEGMLYLHGNHIIHRDLKSDNVLLDAHCRARISDLGSATVMINDNCIQATSYRTNVRWAAPECIGEEPLKGKPTDVYSLAILIWHTITRLYPYDWLSKERDIAKHIKSGTVQPIPEDCPPLLATLIMQCWQMDHSKRPRAAEIVDQLEVIKKQGFVTDSQRKKQASAESPADDKAPIYGN